MPVRNIPVCSKYYAGPWNSGMLHLISFLFIRDVSPQLSTKPADYKSIPYNPNFSSPHRSENLQNKVSPITYQRTKVFHPSLSPNENIETRVLPKIPPLIQKRSSAHKSVAIDHKDTFTTS